jgi:hypothetical protein
MSTPKLSVYERQNLSDIPGIALERPTRLCWLSNIPGY